MSGGSRRILLVAQASVAVEIAARLRAATGWDVTVAHQITLGIRLLQQARWRAVLAADPLPGGSAWEVLAAAEAHRPEVRRIWLSGGRITAPWLAAPPARHADLAVGAPISETIAAVLAVLGAPDTTPVAGQPPEAEAAAWAPTEDHRPFLRPRPSAAPRAPRPTTGPTTGPTPARGPRRWGST